MKHCDNCNRDFDTKEKVCPICGSKLKEVKDTAESDTDEIVSTMPLTGIL